MKSLPLLLCLFICLFDTYGQNVRYNFSASSEGYRGNIKSVTAYISELDTMAIIKQDTALNRQGKIQSIKFFDKKGLLVKLNTYNDLNRNFTKQYVYDDDQNLLSILIDEGEKEHRKEDYQYDQELYAVLQTNNKGQNITVGKKMKPYFSKRLEFDRSGRQIKTEYLDSSKTTLLSVRTYVDDDSRIIQVEQFMGSTLRERYFQTYDSAGRKSIIQSVDAEGRFTAQRIYTYTGADTVLLEMFDNKGNLQYRSKEISIKDDHGNIIKEYQYDLINHSLHLFEYDIQYY